MLARLVPMETPFSPPTSNPGVRFYKGWLSVVARSGKVFLTKAPLLDDAGPAEKAARSLHATLDTPVCFGHPVLSGTVGRYEARPPPAPGLHIKY